MLMSHKRIVCSITATLVFMATAMVVVAVMRHGLGGL